MTKTNASWSPLCATLVYEKEDSCVGRAGPKRGAASNCRAAL